MIQPSEFMAQCKVVLLGSSNAGKTSILRRLVYDKFSENVSPTLGSSLSTFDAKTGDSVVRLNVWDTAGQENYRSLAKVYYRDANVALVVFDVTSKESFSDVDFWLSELDSSESNGYIVVIVANKIDCENRVITSDMGKALSERAGAVYAETSAKTSEGIKELFSNIAGMFLQIKDDPKKNRRYSDLSTIQPPKLSYQASKPCC